MLAAIPSPTTSIWHLGPVPIRAYALCIVAGIVAAALITDRRLNRRGAPKNAVLDVAVWAVPFGIVGARLYHVVTSWQGYFGPGGDPVKALYLWEGGLGIWGAVAGGAVGAWLGCRQIGIPLTVFADALAPGLPVAQAIGRLGNWFNNELYGGVTSLPWGLTIHQMVGGRALAGPDGKAVALPDLYHPTFLYELVWNFGVAVLVLVSDRRFKLGRGRAFALYAMGYTVGRFWIELMRSDPANEILGLRVNVWVSVLVFVGALVYFLRVRGPQEFLLPPAEAKPGAPYQVVTEAQFHAAATNAAWTPVAADQPTPAEQPSSADPAGPTDDGAAPGGRMS
ncbi:prolipoprotein diacylglyceryl transferase [Pilimelia columellifera]|uniref:Phosphatidylglycerol--prolipoprotein diacylglyceryl transferase n=1 Tax=Pilimelia columellifera subsp. columellifera TaxID=706583 RepID=A0ABP6AJG3_9ACTN